MNLLPYLQSSEAVPRSGLCGATYSHDIRSWENPTAGLQTRWCVEREWKLIQHANGDSPELYHLQDDPGESTNLADKYPDQVNRLTRRIDAG